MNGRRQPQNNPRFLCVLALTPLLLAVQNACRVTNLLYRADVFLHHHMFGVADPPDDVPLQLAAERGAGSTAAATGAFAYAGQCLLCGGARGVRPAQRSRRRRQGEDLRGRLARVCGVGVGVGVLTLVLVIVSALIEIASAGNTWHGLAFGGEFHPTLFTYVRSAL